MLSFLLPLAPFAQILALADRAALAAILAELQLVALYAAFRLDCTHEHSIDIIPIIFNNYLAMAFS